LDETSTERVLGLLGRLGFALYANELHYADSMQRLVVLQGLEEFRQHLGGELTVTLLSRIGQGSEVHAMDRELIMASMSELRERYGRKG
jgi:3-dehydroquinate synthase